MAPRPEIAPVQRVWMNNQSDRSREFWIRIRRKISIYAEKYTLSQCRCFKGHEGRLVFFRLLVLIYLILCGYKHANIAWALGASAVTSYFICDILLAHTAIIFIHGRPADIIRTIFLTFLSYITIAISFSLPYLTEL
jgi:hypothetical protein